MTQIKNPEWRDLLHSSPDETPIRMHMTVAVRYFQLMLESRDPEARRIMEEMAADNGCADVAQLAEMFRRDVRRGIECYPIGDCNNWCPIRGCGGHADEETS